MPIQLSNAGVEAVRKSHCHARRLGDDYVGTEHLLLGLLESAQRDPALKYVLDRFNLSLEKGEAALLAHIKAKGARNTGKSYHPNTAHLQKVFHDAQLEADRFGDELVRPRHLLLALIPENWQKHEADPSVAGEVLAQLGLGFSDAKEAVREELVRQERQSYALAVFED